MSNRILSEPRKLSNNELVQLEKAKSKWYPAIVQTYNTSLLDMMASPIKKKFSCFNCSIVTTCYIFLY